VPKIVNDALNAVDLDFLLSELKTQQEKSRRAELVILELKGALEFLLTCKSGEYCDHYPKAHERALAALAFANHRLEPEEANQTRKKVTL